MNTSALITYLITQILVVGCTVYFFVQVLKKPKSDLK
jgi:hypothetical protein